VQREEKSERSRRAVLDAALQLFSQQGYRATSVRDIAEQARVSTGNLYHHFPDKEAIFQELIAEYRELTRTPRYPFTRVLYATRNFPENLEQLGFAAQDSVQQFRQYLALFYVDVIEFGGTHIQAFYGEMADRFTKFFEESGLLDDIKARLRPGVSPTSALLMTSRLFFNYFTLQILFGVAEPFGRETSEVVRDIADVLRFGMCRERAD
jgi:AcrR family transcriptional regulator